MNGDGSCVVLPGLVPADGHVYSDADLRALGKPVVSVADGAIGAAQLDPALGIGNSEGQAVAGLNYFTAPGFGEGFWERAGGAGPVVCAPGVDTVLCDGWWVNPGGAAVTQQQSVLVPVPAASLFALEVTGGPGATAVGVGQNVERSIAAGLGGMFTASFYLHNDTAAAFVPSVRFLTPVAVNNFGATNLQATVVTQACAAGGWTRVTATVDGSTFVGLANGLRVELVIPSGSLAATNQSVTVAQGKLELGQAATAFALSAGVPAGVPGVNLLENGTFSEDTWGGAGVPCPVGMDTMVAGGWWVNPSGANTTVTRGLYGYERAAVLNGAAGLTGIDLGQNIPRGDVGALTQAGVVTFSAWVLSSAGTVTPALVIEACPGVNDFADAAAVSTTNLQACAAGVWTQVSATVALAGATVANGAQVVLRLAAVAAGASVTVAHAKLEAGYVVTPVELERERKPGVAILGASRNLSVVGAGANMTVSADEVVIKDGSGTPMLAADLNVVVDPTTVGAGGMDVAWAAGSRWYGVWVIGDGYRASVVLSTSMTAPTMPGGWTHCGLVGCVWVYSSGGVPKVAATMQVGTRVFMPPAPTALTVNPWDGTTGANPKWEMVHRCAPVASGVWEAVSAAALYAGQGYLNLSQIAPIAKVLHGTIGVDAAAGNEFLVVAVSPDPAGAYGTVNTNITASAYGNSGDGLFLDCAPFSLALTSPGGPLYWRSTYVHNLSATYAVISVVLSSFEV